MSRTPTRPIRRGGGPTNNAATAAWDNDRPPVAGVAGRQNDELHLDVCHHANRAELEAVIEARVPEGPRSTPTSGGRMPTWRNRAIPIPRSTTRQASMLTTMGTACARCMSTPLKDTGPGGAIFCGPFAG